jgi:hypothetical protein
MGTEGEAAALTMAKALVYEWMPVYQDRTENGGDGYMHSVKSPGNFWNGIDMTDPVIVEAKLLELATLIGQVAQKLQAQ